MFLDGRYTGSCKCVLSGQQQPSILHEMQAGWALAEARALTALARSRWVARPFTASAFRRRRSPLAASYPARSVVIYTKTGDNGRSSLFTGCIRTYIHTWAMRHMHLFTGCAALPSVVRCWCLPATPALRRMRTATLCRRPSERALHRQGEAQRRCQVAGALARYYMYYRYHNYKYYELISISHLQGNVGAKTMPCFRRSATSTSSRSPSEWRASTAAAIPPSRLSSPASPRSSQRSTLNPKP